MKNKSIAILMLTLFSTILHAQNDFEKLWKEVHHFELLNQPKSALKIVDRIYEKANQKKNSPQIIKTLLYKSKFSMILEEESQLKVIQQFKAHIQKNTAPTKNVLQNILANMYWQYFQSNRWKFYQRTKTNAKVDSNDFRTWDLETLFAEIHFEFQNSLASTTTLQKIPLEEFSVLLKPEIESKKYRPTLYDFLAHNALNFYKTDETRITKPSYQFKIDNKQLLYEAKQFAALNLTTKDTLSLQFNALKIYKNLIQFHLNNKNFNALVDSDLQRLDFVRSKATFLDKDKLFLETLIASEKIFSNHEASSLYGFEIANYYHNLANAYSNSKGKNKKYRFKNKEALAICNRIIKKFPKSYAAQKSKLLQEKINEQSIEITAEQYVPINKYSRVLINYKNVDQLYFSVYKIDFKKLEEIRKAYPLKKRIELIQKLTKVSSWQHKLPNEFDYLNHTNEAILPKLKQGSYFIVASEKNTLQEDTAFGYTGIQISNLTLVTRNADGGNIYQVLDRNTGKPISKALINFRNENTRYNRHVNVSFYTDEKGEVKYNANGYHSNVIATITSKNDKILIENLYLRERYKNSRSTRKQTETFIFTDRSIYRPGQTIYFKTISLEKENDNSSILTNSKIAVTLKDVNNQTVKELTLKTNDFGSTAGEFILPNTGLTGSFQIVTMINGRRSYENISVEEYKRPKFETNFKPVSESFKLNDSVTVTGTAKAYAGSNITDAKVVYRVHRKVQFPRWYYWYRPSFAYAEPQEIANGEILTNDKGEFTITFKALPDESVSKDQLPVFNYEISADVTDLNGETRSATTIVNVGYHSLIANIDIDDVLNKADKKHILTINTKNLNDEFIPAEGEIKIYKLKAPKYPLRNRPWPSPDFQTISKTEFEEKFPHDPYKNEDNRNYWEKGKSVFTTKFNTEKSKEVVLTGIKKWTSGSYIIELTSKDKFGQTVTDKKYISVSSIKDKYPEDNKLFQIKTDKTSYKDGDVAKVTVSTNSKDVTVMLFVEKNYKTVNSYYLKLNRNSKTIEIPVTKDDLGGFGIQYHFVNYNDFKNGNLVLDVPYPKTDLEIITKTFRDKLQPGANETWSFTIKGSQKDKVTAELLAGMYDASLDQFRNHEWDFYPVYKPRYHNNGSSSARSFKTTRFIFNKRNRNYYNPPTIKYDRFNWFGFNFNNSKWENTRYLNTLRAGPILSTSGTFTGKVSGVISDISGPLPGVNVQVLGSSKGVETDFDGKFSIDVKKGDILVFSFVGMRTREIQVTNFSNIILRLEDDAVLEEVVVAGVASPAPMKRKTRGRSEKLLAKPEAAEAESFGFLGREDSTEENSDGWAPKNSQDEYGEENKKPLSNIEARKNLQETAFFYPQLVTDKDGNVSFNFTIPEALTKWKLQLLAHSKNLHTATETLETVTQKELMVIPNTPRFLREKDQITVSAKISNLTDKELQGTSQLLITDPITGKAIDTDLNNLETQKSFTVDAEGNTNVSWDLTIPETIQAVSFKIVAQAGNFSDGEQNVLPVLSNRMLVTETLPMWVRGNQTKTFTLNKLKNNTSTTLKHHQLTLEVTSNPVWQAVQALPYLMEYPYECSEQTFSRYYANTLASYIANSNPKIKAVFNQWKSSEALISNLEKNQELKSIIIQETPWLRDAQSESEQKKRIALLFDLNKMQAEQTNAIRKLQYMQMDNGGFPWFKGGRYANIGITNHIVTGFGHLQKLGIKINDHTAENIIGDAIQFLDYEYENKYEKLLERAKRVKALDGKRAYDKYLAESHISYYDLQYLYMRSFFDEIKIQKSTQKAIDYYTQQAAKYWNDFNLYGKGLNALIQFRTNNKSKANLILKSLEENSITSEEFGMYWKENKSGWYWHQAPIATQSLLIETFAEIKNDEKTIDNLKIWLLKNKQVSEWKTTKATTNAIYALLFKGTNWLASNELVTVKVGKEIIDPTKLENTKIEAGTGYFKTNWKNKEVTSDKATVTLTKNNKGIAWGGLYWQYFEDLDKISHAKTPLQLTKKLFKKVNSDRGKKLIDITDNNLQVGDLVTVRIELKVDRDMEFIHMKDMRASAFEPTNVLSKYKWQDGLGYYESTTDAATNFFFDRLPKGVYVFEYDIRVNNKGDFSNGITTIQNMYAPEFSSHSKGIRVKIK
ncbi:alpha-2-macroglobulin family protein [uncultured Tenacibaculum sp.]|uniref:alpha-2-macroglobulin family protein n=1 Tax=uncultured Tenacibaculum sp. TaxID=174713 RepID=UPI0026163380|nr:alpha-2-macroglobulin family protein [uncultured Tenacibaculum sp.]